jgi:hypothetical protein
MATMKANGGAVKMFRHKSTGTRYALCANGKLLVNPGGHDGWHVSLRSVADMERLCEVDTSRAAKVTLSRSRADAYAHERAKRLRRLQQRRQAR